MAATATTAVDLVRQATVQLKAANRVGTGFFVARHIIVTCAHVLPGPSGTVEIYGTGRHLTGRILARVPRLPTGRDFPFPDLGFIGVEQGIDTPSAEVLSLHLRPGQGEGIELQVHGFNRETPEPDAVLDIVPLTVIGTSGPYIKVQARGIVRGMSGAPVIDPETGYVCGVMKHYRREQAAAWFIDGLDVRKVQDQHSRILGRHAPQRPRLIRPDPTHPLHSMLRAQRRISEDLPYQVVEGDVPLSTVYVEQSAEVKSSKAARSSGSAERTAISPYEMLARHRNALVVGDPGGGKSTLLQHLVAESVAWWMRPEPATDGEEPPFGPAIAIRCPATRLLTRTAWSQLIADAVNAELSGYQHAPLTRNTFEQAPMPNVDWLILIDGLDEVLERQKRAELIGILSERVSEYGSQARFVVTSRHLVEKELERLRSSLIGVLGVERLGEYNLRPFDPPAVAKFADRWFHLRTPERADEHAAGFLASIDRSHLMGLVSVPLLCTIAADVYQRNPDSPLPVGRTGLYQSFVDGLLHRRRVHLDTRVKIRDQLAPYGRRAEEFGEFLFDERLDCVTYLADQRLGADRQPSVQVAQEWIRQRGREVPMGVTDDHIRELLLSTGLLVNRGDSLEFTHQSIAEYLAAGPAAERFDKDAWIDTVGSKGADSAAMFALDRWATAGNDPMPVIEALAAPGQDQRFPRLPQLAAILEDGAGLSSGRVDAFVEITLQAVRRARNVTDASLPAISYALRAVLQRAGDSTLLVRVARDRRQIMAKRIEAAKVLITEGTPAGRASGMDVLIRLAYQARVRNSDRLLALQGIAEVGDPSERGHAIQHLAQTVETSRSDIARVQAIKALMSVGDIGEAVFAQIRRMADGSRPFAERSRPIDEVWAFVPEEVRVHADTKSGWHERVDAEPGQVWLRPGAAARELREDPWSDFVARVGTALAVAGAFDASATRAAVSTVMHDRTLSWGQRARIAWTLVSDERPNLAQLAFEELADDVNASAECRVVHRWLYWHRRDRTVAESIMRGIIHNDLASTTERRCAMNVLMRRGTRRVAIPFLTACAVNPDLPLRLRIEAALVLGRDPGPRSAATASRRPRPTPRPAVGTGPANAWGRRTYGSTRA